MAQIVDSGERREFESGAVRDIHEGKGAEYLLPLDIVYGYMEDDIIYYIDQYTKTGLDCFLYECLDMFITNNMGWDVYTAFLEVSIHFEDGMRKYGERNWEKGIPTHCFIDSALRHYFKLCRGDNDERHDRAFIWNILCCIWTIKHHPEIDDYRREE